MMCYVLDTNIVSLLIRQNSHVVQRFDSLALTPNAFIACPMVWYEVQRGLLTRDAKLQMRHFVRLFNLFEWQDYGPDDWRLAAQWWTERRRQGLPIHDADVLIAAFTHNRQAALVTDNEKDFVNLNVQLENWAKEDS
jgi:tRNA(fMet)-specific endonuclease VapC